ncbi:MAG: hypothetical protein ABSE49_23140 [Polyangiaceae bacterium]|jgi:hypothetical protein
MRTRFIACEVCARHVRDGDAACPFCGAAAPVAKPLRTVRQRLTRAALHAAGAAGAIAAFNDCGGSSGGSVEAFYGAPCIDTDSGSCVVYAGDAGKDATADAGQDTGAGEVFYGAPCIDGSCVIPADGAPDVGDGSPE